jgi:hypothetical protein
MLKRILEVADLLDAADASGTAVADYLRQFGAEVETFVLEGPGRTELVRVSIEGSAGRRARGAAPTLGVIGRLGGVGARPARLGLVSDGDGAIVAVAVAAAIARMRSHGDVLPGDVLVRTHICPSAVVIPHDPAPFVASPVDRDRLARAEVDDEMAAILSIDSTRANRVSKHPGFAITGAVKDGYILRPTTAMLDVYERVAGHAPVVLPLFTQDITPPGNGVHHINSIMQPSVVTEAPVVGVALLAPVVVGGASTGVLREQELAAAARFVVEVAKEFTAGALAFFHEEELQNLLRLYGSLRHLQHQERTC